MTATVDAAAAHLPLPRLHARGRSTILSLCGECDLATRGQLQVALTQALAGGVEHLLILDLSRLDFCDLSSARLIYEASRADRVVVTGMSASVARMFDLLDPDHTQSRSSAPHDNPHPTSQLGRGLSTSTTTVSPSPDTDGARPESTGEVRYPTPDVRTSSASTPPQQGGLHRHYA